MGLLHKLFGDNDGSNKSSKTTSGYSAYGDVAIEEVPFQIYEAQVGESMEIIMTTLNPGTFFSRYRFLSKTSIDHREAKKKVYKAMTPRQLYDWLCDKRIQNELQQKLIDRMFDAHRENDIIYQMHDVALMFSKESMQYYLRRLGERKFHFCKVKFDVNSDRLYTYVTKNKNLAEGDTVTITTGSGEYKETKLVQVEEVFDDCVQNLPFPLEKLRCIDSTLRQVVCPHCGANIQIDVGKKTGKCSYCNAEFYLI